MLNPAEVPVFRVVQVGEAAIDEGSHEIHRHRRARVAADQALRVRSACLRIEGGGIDEITAVTRQCHAVASLAVRRTRLGVLAGEAADAHDGELESVHEHEAHLQHDLEPVRDQRRGAVVETLGAIAALQQEASPLRRFGQQVPERHDLPRGDQRRQLAQLRERSCQLIRIRINRLLGMRTCLP